MDSNSNNTDINGLANGHKEEDNNTNSDNTNVLTNGESNSCPTLAKSNETENSFAFSSSPTLEQIRAMHSVFTRDRNWDQFHTPRNVLLALVAEMGELAELFQWKNECEVGLKDWTPKERKGLEEELSDCLIYLVRLADRCRVDLPLAVVEKLAKNETKYPINKVFGSSKKYTEYQ